MMNVTIQPKRLHGSVTPPPSKSRAHRVLIAAMLAGEKLDLTGMGDSQDIEATARCLRTLGESGEELPLLDCGESGSTLRFLIPLALALRDGGRFVGRGRLMERPQEPYEKLFRSKDIFWEQKDGVLTVRGRLAPGVYEIAGDVSSQFITGLLYALPLLKGESTLSLTTPLESRDYVSMTLEVLGDCGIQVYETEGAFRIPGGQRYAPERPLTVEADWSGAAFWYAARLLGSEVDVQGMDLRSAQGDLRIVRFYEQLSQPGDVEIDVSQCPDLVPPLAAMGAVRHGVCRLTHAARLRMKESDRLEAVSSVLNALGAQVEEGEDSLTITGQESLSGGESDCRNDHRIAMMAAIAATRCRGSVVLHGAECVKKSYPHFWEEYQRLGGDLHVVISG